MPGRRGCRRDDSYRRPGRSSDLARSRLPALARSAMPTVVGDVLPPPHGPRQPQKAGTSRAERPHPPPRANVIGHANGDSTRKEVPALSWRLRESRAAAPPTPHTVSLSRLRFIEPRRPSPASPAASSPEPLSCSLLGSQRARQGTRHTRCFQTRRSFRSGSPAKRAPWCRAKLDLIESSAASTDTMTRPS